MNLFTTIKGSLMENFFPSGWDLEKIDRCCSHSPVAIMHWEAHWNSGFQPFSCANIHDFYVFIGHEVAFAIKEASDRGEQLAVIFPVGPMGLYQWIVYFLNKW